VTGAGVRWLTAASGLAAAVLVAVGALLGPSDPPGFDALPEQVVRWTLDDRRRLLVGSAVIAVGLALLVVFYSGLRAMVGRAEGAPAMLATVGYASFLVVIALALVGVGFAQVQAFAALDGSPDTVRTFHEARYVMVNLSAAPTIVPSPSTAVGETCAVGWRTVAKRRPCSAASLAKMLRCVVPIPQTASWVGASALTSSIQWTGRSWNGISHRERSRFSTNPATS